MICTRELYRQLMRDTTSYDGDVDFALSEAQAFLEETTGRKFESASRTESLPVDSSGRVYPSATPITSVAAPANSTIDGNAVRVGGSTWDVSTGPRDRISITYTGGYAADDMPRKLAKLVARLAYDALPHDTELPAGATSVKVGDVSYTIAATVDETPSLLREVHSWDNQRLEWY